MEDLKYTMVRLMCRYLAGTLADEERLRLEEWLDWAPEGRRLLEEARDGRSLAEGYEACGRVDWRGAYERCRAAGKRRRGRRLRWTRYAAVLLACVGAAVALWPERGAKERGMAVAEDIRPGKSRTVLLTDDGGEMVLEGGKVREIAVARGVRARKSGEGIAYPAAGADTAETRYNTLRVPRGGEYKVVLSDGTVVYLNSATWLRFPVAFGGRERVVALSGEAFFEVKSDSARPFRVVADGARIEVYGTSFNVNTRDADAVRVALVEGSVGLRARGGKETRRMRPSQLGVVGKSDGRMDVETTDLAPHVAWRKGLFVFTNQTLEQLMGTLSLWYNVDVFFANEEVKRLHFTGCLRRYEDIGKLLKPIGETVGATFSVQGRTVCVSR